MLLAISQAYYYIQSLISLRCSNMPKLAAFSNLKDTIHVEFYTRPTQKYLPKVGAKIKWWDVLNDTKRSSTQTQSIRERDMNFSRPRNLACAYPQNSRAFKTYPSRSASEEGRKCLHIRSHPSRSASGEGRKFPHIRSHRAERGLCRKRCVHCCMVSLSSRRKFQKIVELTTKDTKGGQKVFHIVRWT